MKRSSVLVDVAIDHGGCFLLPSTAACWVVKELSQSQQLDASR